MYVLIEILSLSLSLSLSHTANLDNVHPDPKLTAATEQTDYPHPQVSTLLVQRRCRDLVSLFIEKGT